MAAYPQETRDRARALHAKGKTVAEVARAIGVPHFTAWRWTRGGERRSLQNETPADVKAEAIQRYRDGKTAGDVASFAKVSIHTVRRWIRRAGAQHGCRRKVDWQHAAKRYRALKSYGAVARELGVHKSAVHRAINGRGPS